MDSNNTTQTQLQPKAILPNVSPDYQPSSDTSNSTSEELSKEQGLSLSLPAFIKPKNLQDDELMLARIELANAMLNLDPKSVVIENDKLRANRSTIYSLADSSSTFSKFTDINNYSSSTKNSNKFNSEPVAETLIEYDSDLSDSATSDLSPNVLIDDKETILVVQKKSETFDDYQVSRSALIKSFNSSDYITPLNSNNSLQNVPPKNLTSTDNEIPSHNTTGIKISSSDSPKESSNGRLDNDSTPAIEYFGENKIPDFILTASSMEDIDLVSNSWKESLLSEPEGDFWAAVINNFQRIKEKTPHLLAAKIRNGIPPKLRGIVWQTLSDGRSTYLQTMYYQLVKEHSPHERIILRDLPRTFPSVKIFKETGEHGQKRLFNILKAYSLYDAEVGYCQGLGFVIGPLIMNMGECEAFCVLVRLMETFDLRGMFTEDMEGLHLRLFQFSNLAAQVLPHVWKHLQKHNIYPAMYASSWFLSLFAYALPLGFVLRILDVIFYEGAPETIIRVGITLLSRNSQRILAKDDFESLINILCSGLYRPDSPEDQPKVILNEANLLSNIVTSAKLEELKNQYLNSNFSGARDFNNGQFYQEVTGSGSKKQPTLANKMFMDFFGFGQKNFNDTPLKVMELPFSLNSKKRANQWLNNMQLQKSLDNGGPTNSIDDTGFDLLTISGFGKTAQIEASASPSVDSPALSNRSASNTSFSHTLNKLEGLTISDTSSPNLARKTDSSTEFYSLKTPAEASNLGSKEPRLSNDDRIEPLVRQLHDAKVTAETNFHALTSLRAEHETVITDLARVKLERAELESYTYQLKEIIKKVELERQSLETLLADTNSKLESTELALIKARMSLADDEDTIFNLKSKIKKANEYTNENLVGICRSEILSILSYEKTPSPQIDEISKSSNNKKMSLGSNLSFDYFKPKKGSTSNAEKKQSISANSSNSNPLMSPPLKETSAFASLKSYKFDSSIFSSNKSQSPSAQKPTQELDLSSNQIFPKSGSEYAARTSSSVGIKLKNFNSKVSPPLPKKQL
ncbi:hypothetical protein BB560_000326 [Smittium megazygosporum]|uniref:Rab-GAP TBC domain-containing protein n=1 Tax=Smittium megazygosporum TaxID=133381 RepID=A0A2T9ZKL2_9FUNG|nr:hypothetical protein BB560_000326 [Smittium megazygosporum]